MKINYIKADRALLKTSAELGLASNEYVLLKALMDVYNDQYWPDGAVSIGNNQLLAKTTFNGSSRDDTLRTVRSKLVARGLIEYTPGVPYKSQPQYRICWQCIMPEDSREDTQEDTREDTWEDTREDTREDSREDTREDTREDSREDSQNISGISCNNNNNNTAKDKTKEKKKNGDGDKKSMRFAPPALADVEAYCIERQNSVDAQRFIDYYTSNGWMVGRNRMKDWRSAVRTWERQPFDRQNRNNNAASNGYQNPFWEMIG